MNTKLKAIIVEDEPLARSGLESYVNDVEFIELCAICENAMEANNAISRHQPHLMFLDIQMPRITGIDFLKSLTTPPMVIFTTAYPNYALQGFELDVVDYLVKPYPFDRFLKAVNKAHDLHILRQEKPTVPKEGQEYFFVKSDNRLEKITTSAILYVEAMENYVIIHTTTQKVITLMTMKNIEETLLLSPNFIRVHKSYIVNISQVKFLEGNELMVGHTKIPLSRQKKQEVLDKLLKST